jgi:hypothetical protein
MNSLKSYKADGERNLETLKHNKFRCRFTKGLNIPDWRIVKFDEPSLTNLYIVIEVLIGENPNTIIEELDRYKGRQIDMAIDHLDKDDNVVLTQYRSGYKYGGAICKSLSCDVYNDQPLTITIKFNKMRA